MSGNERTTHVQDTSLRVQEIRRLNDGLRRTGTGGQILITPGIQALGLQQQLVLIGALRKYDRFDDDIDPYMEHDMGSITLEGHQFFWKIDYYDKAIEYGSPDPADPAVTTRILTIMRSDEY